MTTQLPTYSGADFAKMMAKLFPNGWASSDQANPPTSGNAGVLYSLFLATGSGLEFLLGALQYAKNSILITTATAPELDLASEDFFGSALPRPAGMSDAVFATLIKANLFPRAATRATLEQALILLTGKTPRMLEPWSPGDTGAWGISYWGGVGAGAQLTTEGGIGLTTESGLSLLAEAPYTDPDTAATPSRWGSPGLRYQGFIETAQASGSAASGNPPPSWNEPFYWDKGPGLDPAPPPPGGFTPISPVYTQNLYTLLTKLHAEGTIVWVRIVANPQ